MYDDAIDQLKFPHSSSHRPLAYTAECEHASSPNGLAGGQELAQRALSASRSSRPGTAGSGRSRPSSPFLDRLQIDLKARQQRLKVRSHRSSMNA